MQRYDFVPQYNRSKQQWKTSIQVYDYLLSHQDERDRIRQDICGTAPGELFRTIIHHPLLPYGMLVYSTLQDDDEFVRRIELCREYAINPANVGFRRC